MAIRDIVTRGYGNGTYNPGVNKLPTRGYSITVVADHGIILWTLESMTTPGLTDEALTTPDLTSGAITTPGLNDDALLN